MKKIVKLFVSISLILSSPAGSAGDFSSKNKTESFQGEARTEDGDLFYTEVFDLKKASDKISSGSIIYFNADHKKIAQINLDFSKNLFAPDTTFEDLRDQYQYKMTFNKKENSIKMSYKEKDDKNPHEKSFSYKEDMITPQGMVYYLGKNMESLKKSGEIEAVMLMPSRLDTMSILIKVISEAGSKMTINVKPKNPFVRALVPDLQISFNESTLQVLEFRGISNLLDEQDHQKKITISYKY